MGDKWARDSQTVAAVLGGVGAGFSAIPVVGTVVATVLGTAGAAIAASGQIGQQSAQIGPGSTYVSEPDHTPLPSPVPTPPAEGDDQDDEDDDSPLWPWLLGTGAIAYWITK